MLLVPVDLKTMPDTIRRTDLNTYLGVLNELSTGYTINDDSWWSPVAEALWHQTLQKLKRKTGAYDLRVREQTGRGRAMGWQIKLFLSHYQIQHLYHVAQKGTLQAILPTGTDKHPADFLLRLVPRPSLPAAAGVPLDWFGVSCKAREASTDVGPGSNPGLEELSSIIGIDLQGRISAAIDGTVTAWSLPTTQQSRKAYLRADANLLARSHAHGDLMTAAIRDLILRHFPEAAIEEYTRRFLHIDDYPRFVHVVGTGTNDRYKAQIVDPQQVFTGPYRLAPRGANTLAILANGAQVCVWRLRWTDEKLCGTLKLSVKSS